jgi:hypothetical protein
VTNGASLPLIEILYRALAAPLGIVVETDDADFLRQKLYAARRALPEVEELGHLSFVPSPTNPQQLWIVNRNATRGDTPTESNVVPL